jgi:hypothetical protein
MKNVMERFHAGMYHIYHDPEVSKRSLFGMAAWLPKKQGLMASPGDGLHKHGLEGLKLVTRPVPAWRTTMITMIPPLPTFPPSTRASPCSYPHPPGQPKPERQQTKALRCRSGARRTRYNSGVDMEEAPEKNSKRKNVMFQKTPPTIQQ